MMAGEGGPRVSTVQKKKIAFHLVPYFYLHFSPRNENNDNVNPKKKGIQGGVTIRPHTHTQNNLDS